MSPVRFYEIWNCAHKTNLSMSSRRRNGLQSDVDEEEEARQESRGGK